MLLLSEAGKSSVQDKTPNRILIVTAMRKHNIL